MPQNLNAEEIAEISRRYGDLMDNGLGGIASLLDPGIVPLAFVDLSGDRLLHIAAKRGDLDTVERLLNAGDDVNSAGSAGCTALHYAMSWEKNTVADFLLAHGASRDIRNDFGLLPGEKISGNSR